VLNRKRVFDYAAVHRLPAIYEYDPLVREGGLMSYGPDLRESFERAASMVDRIFKGAMPRRSPVRTTDALFVRAQPQDCEIDQSRNSTDGAGAGRRGGRMRLATSVVGTFRTCPDSLTMFEDTVSAVVEYGGSEVDPTWNYRDKHHVSAESLRSGGAGLQRHGSIVSPTI
jgi:hypothetical protein